MGDYVSEMRELIGTRPFLLCGAAVIVLDQQERVFLPWARRGQPCKFVTLNALRVLRKAK